MNSLVSSQPERLASEFLDRFQASGTYLRDNITRLAELALSPDGAVARRAARSIFTNLVERLADSFDPAAVSLYNRLFAQLMQSCRSTGAARRLDRALATFGLATEADLAARAERLRRAFRLEGSHRVKRAIVLSRVTLGADVAITSVILERLKEVYPGAQIVLAGGRKVTELFGGDPRLSFHEINYARAGSTTERLLTWLVVLDAMRELTGDLSRDEYLIIDPDTRLSQLGLLPVDPSEQTTDPSAGAGPQSASRYLFFPSREYGAETSKSLAELTSDWLSDIFGPSEATLPRLSLAPADRRVASAVSRLMKQSGSRRIISINFGVGENPAKRVGADFEQSLVTSLIRSGAAVILDKGAGPDEESRADRIIMSASRSDGGNRRVRVVEAREDNLAAFVDASPEADLVVWRGRIGLLAALIGESDLYIGYDSAGQHIAAALGVPCIDVMAGFTSPRMCERWRPTGPAETQVIAVDRPGDILREVMQAIKDLGLRL